MPGPFQVSTAAHPLTQRGGPQGPYPYSGTLYCFAFSGLTTLEAYSSADAGETWTATGEQVEIGGNVQCFGACRSIAGDYVYLLYVVPSGLDERLEVSRFNLATGAFDDTSAAGPLLTDGAGNSPLLWIEESTDGGFGVLCKTFSAGGQAHAAIATLSADLNTWSTLSEPAGQTDPDHLFNAVGIARGLDGRVHGFVRKATISTDEHSLLHVLVIGESGGVGTAFDEIASEIDNEDFQISAAALDDGTIGVIYNAPDVGVGTNWKLRSAIATSADTPSWAYADTDTSAAADVGSNAGLIGGTSFRAVWNAGSDLFTSVYSAGWNSPSVLASTLAGAISGRELSTNTYGFFFTDFSDDPLPSFYFLAGGEGQTITGVEPITTKELLYGTSGVTGGGLDTCGTPIAVEPSNACNPVDPDTAIDAPGECVPQGYSF
mgnify:CR=1 FL=1